MRPSEWRVVRFPVPDQTMALPQRSAQAKRSSSSVPNTMLCRLRESRALPRPLRNIPLKGQGAGQARMEPSTGRLKAESLFFHALTVQVFLPYKPLSIDQDVGGKEVLAHST